MTNISAKVIAHSHDGRGNEIVTFELEYPRIIHSELMTHRLFSRNAMSSRAVPIKAMVKLIRENTAMPVRFGSNQPGMQDKGAEHDALVYLPQYEQGMTGRDAWVEAADQACVVAEALEEAGYHKQIANRLIEPFQRMKTVVTATEYANFWWLRVDADADPTIEVLAKEIKKLYESSEPYLLFPGEWHTPYVNHDRDPETGMIRYFLGETFSNDKMLTEDEAKAISASCCAQVSYRKLNDTKDKALDIYGRLLSGQKVHASPFEHQATPMQFDTQLDKRNYILANEQVTQDTDWWGEGVTHVDRKGLFWSGNFRGWIQHRQLLDNHTKW